MKIFLVNYTPDPLKSVAVPFLNMGIGRDIKSLDDLTHEEAANALKEIFKSHLDAPLEFATFNFFWQDIPLFLRAQLVRHRIGWGFAERSLRFYDVNLRETSVKEYDWDAIPTVDDRVADDPIFAGMTRRQIVAREMARQMDLYSLLLKEGVDQQDARNIVGVYFPTAMQTTCSYRALRTMLADRLSSQAHPLWQKAAKEIKRLVTEVSQEMGDGLIDGCEMDGKCRWRSKYDRECDNCVARGRAKKHEHEWTLTTSFGEKTQCSCGIMKPGHLLKEAQTS